MFDKLTTRQKMMALGNEMVNRIIKRTQNGLDVFNTKMGTKSPYTRQYFKSKERGKIKRQASQFKPSSKFDVNLTLTGDMLNSLKVKKATKKNVKIGFTPSESKKVFAQEEKNRVISLRRKPVSDDDEKFINGFYDKIIVQAMKEASGKTEIIIG